MTSVKHIWRALLGRGFHPNTEHKLPRRIILFYQLTQFSILGLGTGFLVAALAYNWPILSVATCLGMSLTLLILHFLHGSYQDHVTMLWQRAKDFEEKYESVIHHANSLVTQTDREGKITYVSPNLKTILGYEPEEYLGKSGLAFVPPEHHPKLMQQVQEAFALGKKSESKIIEYPIQKKDGQVIWQSMRLRTQLDKEGHHVGTRSISTDIQEQKVLEQQLRQSEQTYRYLFDKNPNPLLIITVEEKKILKVNEQATQIYGYSSEEFTQLYAVDLYPSDEQEIASKEMDSIKGNSRSIHSNWKHMRKDKSIMDVDIYCHRLIYEGVSADLVLVVDVSHKVRANLEISNLLRESQKLYKALRESEERLRLALDMFPAAFAIYDAELRYRYVNKAGLRDFYNDPAEIIGKKNEEVFPPEFTKRYLPYLQKAAETKKPQTFEIDEISDTSGLRRIITITYVPFTRKDGSIKEIFAMGYNVTRVRVAEEKDIYQTKALDQSSDVIILTNLLGKITFWNQAAENTYGICAEEAKGKIFTKIVAYEYLDSSEEEAIRIFSERGTWEGELTFLNRQGNRVYLLASVSILRNNLGKATGYLSVKKNITERIMAQEKLKISESRLQRASKIAQIGSYEYHIHHGITYWSETLFHLYALDPNGGMPTLEQLFTYLHPEDKIVLEKRIANSFEQRVPLPRTLWRITKFKEGYKYFLGMGELVEHEDGELKLVGTVQDVTEQTLMELDKLKFAQRLEIAVEAAQLGIWDWNVISNQLIWEPKLYEILDIDPKDQPSSEASEKRKAWLERIHPEDRDFVLGEISKFVEGQAQEVNENEYRIIRRNGEVRYIRTISKRIRTDKQGKLIRGVGVDQDITEIKKAHMRIVKMNEELENKVNQRTHELQIINHRLQAEIQEHIRTEKKLTSQTRLLVSANQELEAFSYSVSHDLMAPLRGINSYTEMLKRSAYQDLNESGQRYLDRVIQNSEKMEILINDLLNYSRIARYEMHVRKFDLKQLVEECLQELTSNLPKSLNIHLQMDDLPLAYGDRSILRQAISNLLSNAIKFSRDRPQINIWVGGWPSPQANIYFIKDNGVGFDNKYVRKIFGVFQRLHYETEFEGTGVGLAIVDRIIRRHQGKVWAKAQKDNGACFYFTLPNKIEE